MSDRHPLPPAAALMELDPSRPHSALQILTAAGHRELGLEYVAACDALNRCCNAVMKMHLADDQADEDLAQEEFAKGLPHHPGVQQAQLAKRQAWARIEAVRDAAVARLLEGDSEQ